MPLVMLKARGAICQSVTQVWLKRRHQAEVGATAAARAVLEDHVGKLGPQPVVDGVERVIVAPVAVLDEAVAHMLRAGPDPRHVVVQTEEVELVLVDHAADLILHPLGDGGLVRSSRLPSGVTLS